MKMTDHERIEKQLSPDDELIRSVMDKAKSFLDEPEKAQAFLQEHDNDENSVIKHAGRYAFIAAAAFVLVFGTAAFIRNNDDNSIKTDTTAASKSESKTETIFEAEKKTDRTSSVSDMSSISEKDSNSAAETAAPSANASQAEIQTTHKTETEPEQPDDTVDDGRDKWFPDAGFDYSMTSGEDDGYQQAAVLALPIEEYRDIEMNGINYHFACGDYGDIWESYIGSNNIPNSSYIDEYITTVDAASLYGDIRPNTQAEIYSLKYADTDFLLAVRFPNFNNDQRYYLFANMEKTYETLTELMYALNIDRYTFNGQAINVYDGMTKYINDDSELTQMLFSADGELTDTAYGEAAWKTYLDTPMYGASVNFTCYSEGYIAVNVFGNEMVYNVGTDTTSQITGYINENSHE